MLGCTTAALAVGWMSSVPAFAGVAPMSGSSTFSWAALGDSYTAGAIDSAGAEYESPRDGCVRTDRSYPQVIAENAGALFSLTNVSCGNATIANIATTGQFPIGHQIPGLSTDPDYPFEQVPVQLQAVHADTDVVTVGIGGNTLGFGEILQTCVDLGEPAQNVGAPCQEHYTHDDLGGGMEDRFRALGAEYRGMLAAIHAKAPTAKILTVGYPYIIPEVVTTCVYGSLLGFSTVTHGDLAWLRTEVLEKLNDVIRDVAEAEGHTFVDIYNSSRGHSVCDKAGGNNWVDGIFSSLIPFKPALVHPNAKGHANAADRVGHAMLTALNVD
jgi:lysophospholipase L1-like esterase